MIFFGNFSSFSKGKKYYQSKKSKKWPIISRDLRGKIDFLGWLGEEGVKRGHFWAEVGGKWTRDNFQTALSPHHPPHCQLTSKMQLVTSHSATTYIALVKSHLQLFNSQLQLVSSQLQQVNSRLQQVTSHFQLVNSQLQLVSSHFQLVNSHLLLVTSQFKLI